VICFIEVPFKAVWLYRENRNKQICIIHKKKYALSKIVQVYRSVKNADDALLQGKKINS